MRDRTGVSGGGAPAVEVVAREKAIRPLIANLHHSRDWRDLGVLKMRMIDYWISQRNKLMKNVVKKVEARRKQGLQ